MTNDQFTERYFDNISVIENNNIEPYRYVILPQNCIMLGFQLGNSMKEVIDEKEIDLPVFTIDGQFTRKKEYIGLPGSKILLLKFKPHTASLFFPNLHAPSMCGPNAAPAFFHAAYNLMHIRNGMFTTIEVFGNSEFVTENGLYELRDSTNNLIDNGKYLVLWKKTEKGWKMFRDCFNSNNPPKSTVTNGNNQKSG